MATPNFYTENCSRYFVIGTAQYYTQEDLEANGMDPEMLGEYDPDGTSFNYECERDNILDGLEAMGWEAGEGPTLATYSENLLYGGCEFLLTLQAQMNPGYYSWGACMDFDGTVTVYDNAGNYVNKYDAFGRYAPKEQHVREDNWTGVQGLSSMQAHNIITYISSIIAVRTNQAEKVFSQFADHEFTLVGRFSNGGALYNEVNKRLCEA